MTGEMVDGREERRWARSEVRARHEGGMETRRSERALERKRAVITGAPPGLLCDKDFTSVWINLFPF